MGGDYGFAWNPHGDYARELTFFVQTVGFSPMETIVCATRTGAEIMGRSHEFGTVEPGKMADILVVDGDVLADIAVLEDRSRFIAVMQGGIVKAGQLAASWGMRDGRCIRRTPESGQRSPTRGASWKRAREHFEHALRLVPGSVQARYNLGVVYRDLELSERRLGRIH